MTGTGAQDEIRAVFDQLLEAQNAGDAQGVRSRLSQRPDAVHIGTDAEEWWTSKQIVDALAAAGGADEIQAVADDVGIHVLGDVAWVEGRGRFTAADGEWKVVQSHASIGIPNADIFG
jgi:ketosteroid isomerase-like protein